MHVNKQNLNEREEVLAYVVRIVKEGKKIAVTTH